MEAIALDIDADELMNDADDPEDAMVVQATDTISPYLFRMMQEHCTCKSILAVTRAESSCDRYVQCCRQNPEQVFYSSPGSGRTPFLEACLRGHCRHIISALLEANPLAGSDRDVARNTPLHLLFADSTSTLNPNETEHILTMLLRSNPHTVGLARNNAGDTVLHKACSAPEAMINSACLVKLLEACPESAKMRNNRNQSPLHLHCRRANASVQVAKLLVKADLLLLGTRDTENGWAPIHYAAAEANYPLLEYLIHQTKAAVSLRTSRHSESVLHLLFKNGNFQNCPATLLQAYLKADPAAVTHSETMHSKTPLHLLCQKSTVPPDLVRELLTAGRGAASVADRNQYLPIHYACEVGALPQVIELLLKAYPEGAKVMTRKQDTALSLACSTNQSVDSVQMLIDANPSALTHKNDYGYAPIHCVCRAYQPRMGIVEALVETRPECVALKTNAGETAMHLASSNAGVFVGILKVLNTALRTFEKIESTSGADAATSMADKKMTNKVGNTPLHDACFRGSSFEMLETLAMANPKWINIRNVGGYTPLQILIKCGRLDERIVTFFSQLGGPEIFSILDFTGNTPLHSAMRGDTDVATVHCLIRARPESLSAKTVYGDTPLHLACFRLASPDVVREVVMAGSMDRSSPVLVHNSSGQTPISIAMEEFRSSGCGCHSRSSHASVSQRSRSFQILAILVKVLFYGTENYYKESCSLVHACVSLHRRNIRLDPAFIRQVIHTYPGEVKLMDVQGSYPLHIEASIPVEKMALLDSPHSCVDPSAHERSSILRLLLEMYPEATSTRNEFGEFPLGLMIQNGRVWGHTMALALRSFPEALHWCQRLDDNLLPNILEKAGRECGSNTLFVLLCNWPGIAPFARESPTTAAMTTTT